MPSAIDPIITTDDLNKYLTGDPDLYIQIASDCVRAFCNWHIWPNITQSIKLFGTGNMALPLPTLQATSVANVVVDGVAWDDTRYELQGPPNNQLRAKRLYHDISGYVDYDINGSDTWRWGYNRFGYQRPVTLDLTHGYVDVPIALKGVVLNLAGRAQAMPSTWLRSMQSETYRYEFVSGLMSRAAGPAGVTIPAIGGFQITGDEMNQLARYWIPGIA
jgi:hypothetical protein